MPGQPGLHTETSLEKQNKRKIHKYVSICGNSLKGEKSRFGLQASRTCYVAAQSHQTPACETARSVTGEFAKGQFPQSQFTEGLIAQMTDSQKML